jgi:hypothetical protein
VKGGLAEREGFASMPPKSAEMLDFLFLDAARFVPPCWITDKPACNPDQLPRADM